MRRNRLKMIGAATVGAVVLSATGLAGTAQADPVDDVSIVIENVPAALEELVAQVQASVEVYTDTQSVDAAVQQLLISPLFGDMEGVPSVVNELVQGTEQFGALGLGSVLLANAIYGVLSPIVTALDDPATIGDAFNPDDITTILDALPAALDEAMPFVAPAVAALLEGNLVGGSPLIGMPSAVGNSLVVAVSLLSVFEGTNFANVSQAGLVLTLVAGFALGGYLVDAEEALAPLAEALAPVTAPIIEALQGV